VAPFFDLRGRSKMHSVEMQIHDDSKGQVAHLDDVTPFTIGQPLHEVSPFHLMAHCVNGDGFFTENYIP